MSITGLTPLVNTNTFGQWKDRTNEIIESLEDAITIGDAEQNVGNLVITGNITSTNTVISDTISPYNQASNIITLTATAEVEGNISVDNTDSGITKISLRNAGVTTWEIETDTAHENLNFSKGVVSLTIDEQTQTLTGTNITVDEAILPADLNKDVTGNLTGNVLASNGTTVLQAGTTGSNAVFTGSVTGNATTATTLATSHNISLSGDVTGSVGFNGSSDVTIIATVADDSHNHVISNVDGLQTALDGKASTTSVANLTNTVDGKANLAGSAAQDFSADTLNANTIDLGNWTITETNNFLYFAFEGVNRMRLDSSGNLIVVGDVTAYGDI